jgi:hypothetical protein
MGGTPVLWVETEHFKLGSTLESCPRPKDARERRELDLELRRLRERLPKAPRSPGELDPWLRLHLFAQRLEETWDDFVARFRLAEVDWSAGRPSPQESGLRPVGPYLGMGDKLTVLVCQRHAEWARYARAWLGAEPEGTIRHYLPKQDGLFLGLSLEQHEGPWRTDRVLHLAVLHGVVINMVNGLGGFSEEAPPWFQEGLARWYMRRLDERWQLYAHPPGERPRGEEESDWAPRVRARVRAEYFPTTAEMLAWKTPAELAFADHMILWSRVDWLLDGDAARGRAVLLALAEPVPWFGVEDREALLERRRQDVFQRALGLAPEAADAAWAAWVGRSYPAR